MLCRSSCLLSKLLLPMYVFYNLLVFQKRDFFVFFKSHAKKSLKKV